MNSKKERYKRTMLDLAKNEDLVSGIYNYCDRWCERCTKTRKCLTYLHEQEMKEGADAQNSDDENQHFWEQIRLAWEVTMELIEEDADRLGIDLNNVPEIELPEHIETPLEVRAKDYGFKMHDWLEKNREYIAEKAEQLVMIADEALIVKYKDALEVLQWYYFFIGTKVHRAHLDLEERQNDPEDEYSVYSDNLGSAKIAIIAIERSMDALSVFYDDFKEREDDILGFLAELSSLKKQLLKTFPGVMDFKRPGFDD
ncbi:hypothetical protein [Maribellus sp. YY47]|uniref:hypothetical protein n=1 Tax=Maribellus sp. YY47 TaxID=2929486 RepID=UPI002001D3A6|nr:hypothetical protein [Maribellus sp. YY47]MCK3685969.1 hypothetical protein [Maribellus sp. YY47]